MWTLTVRRRGAVERERLPSLDAAVARMESWLDELVLTERRGHERSLARTMTPDELVAVRAELRGPGRRRGGVDLKGDGTSEAYTGRIRRAVVERRPGETSYDALRRALSA